MLVPAMRVLHTSDWHLGRTFGEWSLETDQRAMLRFVVDVLEREPHDLLIVAGDVYDRSVPSESAVELWSDFLRDLRRRSPATPLVAIAGNHDSASRLATASRVLDDLSLHLRGATDAIDVPIRIRTSTGEEADVFAIPFLWPGALNAHRDGEETRLSNQVSALGEAMARIDAVVDRKRIAIAVSHCLVLGGKTSDSERTIVGTATSVDAGLFDRFDYAALGHLHRGQRVGRTAHYSGSPLPYSFSEAGDTKALLSVDVVRGKPPVVRPIPIPGIRGVVELRGELHDLLSDPDHERYVEHFVWAVLTDPTPPVAPMALLRRRFPFVLGSPWVKPGSAASRPDAPMSAAVAQGTSVADDFRAFEARLGRDLANLPGVASAFDRLLAELDDGREG